MMLIEFPVYMKPVPTILDDDPECEISTTLLNPALVSCIWQTLEGAVWITCGYDCWRTPLSKSKAHEIILENTKMNFFFAKPSDH